MLKLLLSKAVTLHSICHQTSEEEELGGNK
jgi:hypothetical protein